MFGRENFSKLGESLVVCQILPSKFQQCLMTYVNTESKLAGICQSFTEQYSLMRNLPKLSSTKHSRSTVWDQHFAC